jgi:RHS repeat-associated protein
MTEMYSYTVSGQVTAKRLRVNRGGNNADLELHIAYDGEGRIASVTYPFGDPALSYTYDSMGRLNGVSTTSDAVVKDVAYDSLGKLTSMKLFAKNSGQYLVQGYQYNARNRATRLIAAPADSTVADGQLPSLDLAYGYRPDGKLQTETDNIAGKSVSYDYDNQGRISTVESSDASWGMEYDYDAFGNRTSQTVTQGEGYSLQARYDPATNWMLGGTTDYDANGNLILLPDMQMKYDAVNRLMRVDTQSGTERYGYNHKNLRIWKQSADGNESFSFYHGTRNLATYALATDASGNLSFSTVKTNIYFGKRLAQTGGDVVVTDRLGATRAWSAKQGAKRVDYMPFGQKVSGSADHSKFGGYEHDDASGLDYAEQRYYGSTMGRFMSPDPYEKSAHVASPESWNRYAFVGNDPINRTDPHGLSAGNDAYWTSNDGWVSYGRLYGGGGGGGGSYGGGGGSYGGGSSYGGYGSSAYGSNGAGYQSSSSDTPGSGASNSADQTQLVSIMNQATVTVAPSTPASLVPAVTIALQLLSSPNACSQFFANTGGPPPYVSAFQALSQNSFNLTTLGPTVGASSVEGSFGTLPMKINVDTFFNPGYTITGTNIATNSLLGQVETILHELGHEVNSLPSDGTTPGLSMVNSITINAACTTAIQQLIP